MNNTNRKHPFDVTQHELLTLLRMRPDPARRTRLLLWVVAALLTPITLAGALAGYIRAYWRFSGSEPPVFYPMQPITRVAMVIGAVLIWAVLILSVWIINWLFPDVVRNISFIAAYIGINLFFALLIFIGFWQWRMEVKAALAEEHKFGSARFATLDDLQHYFMKQGIFCGGSFSLPDKGHILTCAGTRSGKFTNLIAPNLLGVGAYQGSWVVIDPKGEIAAVTARYQRELGRKVVILNPWDLLAAQVGQSSAYNPLDILKDHTNPHLVDDVQMIAEMIVPIDLSKHDSFFTDNARAIVAGLLLHMATYEKQKELSLKELWQWVRLPEQEFKKLLEDMHVNDHEQFGLVVQQAAFEIEKLIKAGDKTFGSIIATVLQCTDFIKSPSLQKAMRPGYDPKELSKGDTALYIIIPADKLKSHSRWLRLVITTTMRSVVRNPDKNVCFLLDEFASLGYLPEVSDIALGTYAGFNVTVWPIVQSLIQLKGIYGDGWENFIGNTAVRQYFGVNDNFTADYISAAIGMTSHTTYKKNGVGMTMEAESNQRPLVTPDEVRRGSGDRMFAFFGNHPVITFDKIPYYIMTAIEERYDENPYYRG